MAYIDHLSVPSVIGKFHPLPSPRGAALELMRLSQDENTSVREIARVAQADPVLAGRLIHAANGSMLGAAPPAGSVTAAVMRLGLSATRQIALCFSLVSEHREGACRQFDYKAFWTSSLLRGLAAQGIALRLGTGDPHEALACGLLAEVGRLAFATARAQAYGELLSGHGQQGAALRAAERSRFGMDHAALGCALLELWNMPNRLIAPVDGYFAPPIYADGVERGIRRMSWTLVLAESVVSAASAPAGQRDAWTHLALDAAARLDADIGMLDELATDISVQSRSWAPLLELPVPDLAPGGFGDYALNPIAAPEERRTLNILLVEDLESDRVLTQIHLEGDGHRVRVAESGLDALESIAACPPQLVITDIDMPRMNGFALCRALRGSRLGASMHVLALTGRTRHEDLVRSIDAGVNDFVAKSANPAALLARVQAAAISIGAGDELKRTASEARQLATELSFERCLAKAARGTPAALR